VGAVQAFSLEGAAMSTCMQSPPALITSQATEVQASSVVNGQIVSERVPHPVLLQNSKSSRTDPTATNGYHLQSQQLVARATFSRPNIGILAIGAVLCMCSGMVNVISFLELGSFVSHVSGTTSKVGINLKAASIGDAGAEDVQRPVLLILSFISGSCFCGLLAGRNYTNDVLIGKSVYGTACIGNSVLIILAMLTAEYECAMYISALACGLQNGMCTMHFGSIVRTTHVTGLATDLGTNLGRLISILTHTRLLRACSATDWAEWGVVTKKLQVYLLLGFGFALGSFSGAWLVNWLQVRAFIVPAAISALIGCTYLSLKEPLKRRMARSLSVESLQVQHHSVEMHRSLQQTIAFLKEAELRGTGGAEVQSLSKMFQHIEATVLRRYPHEFQN